MIAIKNLTKNKNFYFFFLIDTFKCSIRIQQTFEISMKFTNKAMITTCIPVKTNDF